MPGLTCAPSSPVLAAIYLVVGLAFIAYGVVIVRETEKVVEIETRYDYLDACRAHQTYGAHCSVPINVTSSMSSPIFLYYSIKSMYLNNRYFSKSRDALQLMGNIRSKEDVQKTCYPVITMKDLGLHSDLNLDSDHIANPCGLLPRALFNDTYALETAAGSPIPIKETGIAWKTDLRTKYEKPSNWNETQWVDVENGMTYTEHFMVWMGVSALPHFRKLWGKIEQTMEAGQYILQVESNYDTSRFGGEKWVVLSSACAFGGRITFLGIVYIAVGGVSALGSIVIATAHCLKARRLRVVG